jgi:hypothetical protein
VAVEDAVDGLGGFFALPEVKAAQALKTGTDDAPVEGGAVIAQCVSHACRTRATRVEPRIKLAGRG